MRAADVHPAQAAVVIERGQAAAGVGADRQPLRRCAGRVVALPSIGCGPRVFILAHRECGDVDRTATLGQPQRFLEQRLAPIDMRRMEDPRRQFGFVQRAAHQCQPAHAVAQMQMQHSGLAGHQSGDVRLGRDADEFIEGRLAGAVVADRQLADADHRVEEHDVAADAACQRDRRQVIAAAPRERAQPLLAQRMHRCQQFARRPCQIVGAQHPDHRRHPGRGEPRQRHRRHPRRKPALAAAAGDMGVAVDQTGDEAFAGQVDHIKPRHERRGLIGIADPENPAAADQQLAQTQGLRREHRGVADEGQGGGCGGAGADRHPAF